MGRLEFGLEDEDLDLADDLAADGDIAVAVFRFIPAFRPETACFHGFLH